MTQLKLVLHSGNGILMSPDLPILRVKVWFVRIEIEVAW